MPAALNLQRAKLLNMIVPSLQNFRSRYLKGPVICENKKKHCDQLVLGGIVQVLEEVNPYKVSLKSLIEILQKKKISRLCGGGDCGI